MLTGKWIVLRALERDDLKLIHKWQNDEEVMRLARSQPDHAISMEALAADIGLAIGEKDRWRKGYGTEVVSLLLKAAFEQLNLHRAGWWTYAENKASIALAEKMGFKEEGRLRENVFFDNSFHDTVVLGLLKNEYDRSQKGR